MRVDNKPPYGSKEYDLPPPNYEDMPKPKKKEYKGKFEKKGAKFSPTDNLDLILDCGNGWKIYVGKPKEKYLYKAVKDEATEPNREKWAEIKSDMLEVGFQWNWKDATFIRWTTNADDTIQQMACNVLSKYWAGASQPKEKNNGEFDFGDKVKFVGQSNEYYKNGEIGEIVDILIEYNQKEYEVKFESGKYIIKGDKLELIEKSQPKEETPKEPQIIPQGTAFELIDNDGGFWKGETGVLSEDYYIGNTYVEAYMNSERRPDYTNLIPFKMIRIIDEMPKEEIPKEEIPKEETPKEDGKIPLVKIVDVWGQFGTPNKEFTNFEDLEKEFFQTEIPTEGYDKYKFKFEWADGSYIIDRIDVGYSESDFNPSVRTFEDYVDYLYNTSSEKISVFYEYEMKEPFNRYSTKFSNEPKEEKPKEFKVGDKVRLVKDIDKKYYPNNQELELGDIGIVKNREGYSNMYDVEFNGKEIYLDSSYFELIEKAPTREVNLDQYIDDLNLLLELTPNESKKLELATYISDLNTLKLLQ
jgi:hypothetical protein